MDSINKAGSPTGRLGNIDASDVGVSQEVEASEKNMPVVHSREDGPKFLPNSGPDSTAKKINYKGAFNQVTAMELMPAVFAGQGNKDVSKLFREAAFHFGKLEQGDKQAALKTLIGFAEIQADKYVARAAVTGSGLASKDKQLASDMLNTLKTLAENKELDEASRSGIQEKMPALEARLNVEYELRSDKQNGVYALRTQSKSS